MNTMIFETRDSTCHYNRQSQVFRYSTMRLCQWGSPSTSIKPYNGSAMASTLETMQGSTGIVMRHQSISQDNQCTAISNNQTLVSSYTALEPPPSIHPVARGVADFNLPKVETVGHESIHTDLPRSQSDSSFFPPLLGAFCSVLVLCLQVQQTM